MLSQVFEIALELQFLNPLMLSTQFRTTAIPNITCENIKLIQNCKIKYSSWFFIFQDLKKSIE